MADARIGVVSCAFVCFGCRSEPHALFAASYTRSNKKRNAKLLRCFPHCCPNHVPRSYCGCSMHLLVTFESNAAAAAANHNDHLLVSARFESTLAAAVAGSGDVVIAMPPGATVALPASATMLSGSSSNAMESDWIRATKVSYFHQNQLPEHTMLYELNDRNSPMWYYSYESGSTKAQREMKHVLAAYVFVLHPNGSGVTRNCGGGNAAATGVRLATVVARQPSPSFTMVSYRRHNNGSRSGQERTSTRSETGGCVIKLAEGATMTRPLEYRFPSPVHPTPLAGPWPDHRGLLQVVSGVEEGQTEDCASYIAPGSAIPLQERERPNETFLLHGPPEPRCLFCEERLTLQSHSLQLQTLDLVQLLLVLRLFARSTPLETFSFYFSEMDARIRTEWLFNIPPIQGVQSWTEDLADHTVLAEMKSALSLAHFVSNGDETTAKPSNWMLEQAVLRSCADLLLDVFSSPRIQEIFVSSTSVDTAGQRDNCDRAHTRSKLCGQFSQMIADIFDELTQLIKANIYQAKYQNRRFGQSWRHESIPALVDDILSLIYSERKYQALRDGVTALLLRKNDSLEIETRELFWSFTAQVRHEKLNDVDEESDPLSGSSRAVSGWCRRWFLDPTSVLVAPSHLEVNSFGSSNYGKPSLLTTLALVRMLASVDMVLDGTRLTIEAASSEETPVMPGAVLDLDGQTHSFDVLPSDLLSAAAVAVFSQFWGVNAYKGFVADDGMSMDVSLVMLPNFQVTSTDSDVVLHKARVTLALDDAQDACGDHLDVRAEMFQSRLPSHQVRVVPSELVDHVLDSRFEVEWPPVVEIGAAYVAAHQDHGEVS